MSGLLAIVSREQLEQETLNRLSESINLSQSFHLTSLKNEHYCFAVTSLKNTPLKGERSFESSKWIVMFSGDIVEHEEIPYDEIIDNLENGKTFYFKGLNGIFAVAAYNKEENRLYIISDRRSQQPVYFFSDSDCLCVSTDLSTFCRLKNDIQFNEEWLWEYLYFNYPVGDSSFLQGVRRMPAASILEYARDTQEYSIHEYAERFRKKDVLLDGTEALVFAAEVFSRRIPKYYEGASDIACALTGGWDGRTMLALAPENTITAYTYGVPGCHDLEGGGRTARSANIRHIGIAFDEAFTSNLQQLMLDTVFLSSGLQGVLRATLLYAYDELTECGNRFPLTISGLSMDMQFRGHAATPALISNDTAKLFEGGETAMREAFWSSLLKTDYSSFNDHITQRLQSLKADFGGFTDTEHHLSYILYILSTQYFCGEINIAGHFTTVRVPCWDAEIMDLSYSIAQSTLSFSQFSPHVRGDIRELVLQSYLLHTLAPRFGRIPIGNTRPDIVLKGKTMHQVYRIYRGVVSRIAGMLTRTTEYVPLEDWDRWLNEYHKRFIDDLIFSRDSRIRSYIRDDYLETLKKNRNTHYIGKLASAEIILRLVENNWKRFW